VFLSTDAGASGLNLQIASTLINMDLPWNPALLEQRIGRIHRMGQKRPVQIVNLVAKGTIEEGMLSVLAFKRSLSAGILDGGSGEVSLGGSRLTRFMKDVEKVTGQMGEAEVIAPAEEMANVLAEPVEAVTDAAAPDSTHPHEAEPAQGAAVDPWRALAQIGTQLIAALAVTKDTGAPDHAWLVRDPVTGSRHLRIPMPPAQTSARLADALSAVASALRGHAG
jgi:hypothetical protein